MVHLERSTFSNALNAFSPHSISVACSVQQSLFDEVPIRVWPCVFCDSAGNHKACVDFSVPGCVKLG